jgi:hypothetical protein
MQPPPNLPGHRRAFDHPAVFMALTDCQYNGSNAHKTKRKSQLNPAFGPGSDRLYHCFKMIFLYCDRAESVARAIMLQLRHMGRFSGKTGASLVDLSGRTGD